MLDYLSKLDESGLKRLTLNYATLIALPSGERVQTLPLTYSSLARTRAGARGTLHILTLLEKSSVVVSFMLY